jgi:hypothetical protein
MSLPTPLRWDLLKQLIAIVLSGAFLAAQTVGPERTVEGNVVVSERDPKVRVHLPKSAQYIGADRWVLYGMADCELHAFVNADAEKHVHRVYWVQFEGYLPSRPELQHTYNSRTHADIGSMDFYVDTWVRATDEKIRPGSDLEHIFALIRSRGFVLPQGMTYVRLVHLFDGKRKELMIIYAEDVAWTGLTAAELRPNGKRHDGWPTIEKETLERAEKSVGIEQAGHRAEN